MPRHIRSDNGGECIARAIARVAGIAGVAMLSIATASTLENGYAESFHSRLRDELLNAEEFADVREARALAVMWPEEYNHRRPHSSLLCVPPTVYAAAWRKNKEGRQLNGVDRGDEAPIPSQALPPTSLHGNTPATGACERACTVINTMDRSS